MAIKRFIHPDLLAAELKILQLSNLRRVTSID